MQIDGKNFVYLVEKYNQYGLPSAPVNSNQNEIEQPYFTSLNITAPEAKIAYNLVRNVPNKINRFKVSAEQTKIFSIHNVFVNIF